MANLPGAQTPLVDSQSGLCTPYWFLYLAGLPRKPNAPTTITAITYTLSDGDSYLIANKNATITLTLPAAGSFPGRQIIVKTIQAQTVVSFASDVVPLVGGAAGTAILAATAGKWASLVSDGSAWNIMAAN